MREVKKKRRYEKKRPKHDEKGEEGKEQKGGDLANH